jgi:hypothetical protein
MTHEQGASDTLAAIQGRLDGMDLRFGVMETRFDAMYATLQLQGAMLRVHGDHFGRLEAKLVEHDRRFDRVDVKLAEHDARFDRVDEALQKILTRLDALRA